MSDPVTAQGGEERHPATDSDVETDELAERVSEPSTEQEPGEEPKAPPGREEAEPSHEAVGIGVLDSSGHPKQVAD